MKIKMWKRWAVCPLAVLLTLILCDVAYAAEKTTITVNAVDEESGVYRYAIDDITEDACWQESNVFYVESGTTHTIYVKDAAGNITSSEVYAEEVSSDSIDQDTDTADNLDVSEISETNEVQKADYSDGIGTGNGVGTITDYVSDGSKEFYTITTTNGNSFYLIIDHRNNDSNVYFTKPVSELDLLTLAAEAGQISEADLTADDASDVLEIAEETVSQEPVKKKGNIFTENMSIFLVVGAMCAAYYFLIYKKKRAEASQEYDEDAAEMEQFIPVEDEDDAALFHYKGNGTDISGDYDSEDYLDEFYENNADYMDEPIEETDSEEDSVFSDENSNDEIGMNQIYEADKDEEISE